MSYHCLAFWRALSNILIWVHYCLGSSLSEFIMHLKSFQLSPISILSRTLIRAILRTTISSILSAIFCCNCAKVPQKLAGLAAQSHSGLKGRKPILGYFTPITQKSCLHRRYQYKSSAIKVLNSPRGKRKPNITHRKYHYSAKANKFQSQMIVSPPNLR